MSSINRVFSLRKNLILLIFITNTCLLSIFWFLIVIISLLIGSTIFKNPDELFMDILMVFIFPFIVGGIISGVSLVLTALIRQKWWISIIVIIALFGTPIFALALTWIGSLIARAFYQPSCEDEIRVKRFLNMSISTDNDKSREQFLGQRRDELDQLRIAKKMLDENLITQEDYEQKKQIVFSEISQKQIENIKNESETRLFSSIQLIVAAFLGGFLGGAFLIYLNHKRLGKADEAKVSLIAACIGCIISSSVGILITGFVSPSQNPFILLISFIYPVVIYLWHKEVQKSQVDSLLASKSAKISSWLLVILVGVASFILVTIITFLLVWVLTANGVYPRWYLPSTP